MENNNSSIHPNEKNTLMMVLPSVSRDTAVVMQMKAT